MATWGVSLRYNAPVSQVVGERFGGIARAYGDRLRVVSGHRGRRPRASFAGRHRDGAVARIDRRRCVTICYLLAATPAFWLAMLALTVFGVCIGMVPAGLLRPVGAGAGSVTLGVIAFTTWCFRRSCSLSRASPVWRCIRARR